MGQDFFSASESARQLFEQADDSLGFTLSKIMFEGPEDELTRTAHCQPALYLHGLVALQLLQERVPSLNPVAAAGLSLGEFTAHAAAGSFALADGLRLVARRGAFMEEACNASQGAMAAMIGGQPDDIRALAKTCDVDVANYNAPGQIVLSGHTAGIDSAVEKARDAGVRKAVKLKVAGAYHSRLMATAQNQLAKELATVELNAPKFPVVSNYAAQPAQSPDHIRQTLEAQVTGSVRWVESIEWLTSHGHHTFIELGPGKILAGLVSKISRDAEIISIEDLPTLDAAVEKLTTS